MPEWYRWLMIVSVLFSSSIGLALGKSGSLWFAAVPVVVSWVGMYSLRQLLEYGKPDGMFNPATQSWAFLMDGVGLPLAFGAAALSWTTLSGLGRYYETRWWVAIAAVCGAIAAMIFRYALNAPAYHKNGLGDLLSSPTSLWHDYVVYTVLVTLFVAICVPAMVHDFSGYGKYVLVGFVLWLAGGAADATLHQLDGRNLHPPVQETRLAP